jgi:hypothetical protein
MSMTARQLYNALGQLFAEGASYDTIVYMECPAWGSEEIKEVVLEQGAISLVPESGA